MPQRAITLLDDAAELWRRMAPGERAAHLQLELVSGREQPHLGATSTGVHNLSMDGRPNAHRYIAAPPSWMEGQEVDPPADGAHSDSNLRRQCAFCAPRASRALDRLPGLGCACGQDDDDYTRCYDRELRWLRGLLAPPRARRRARGLR